MKNDVTVEFLRNKKESKGEVSIAYDLSSSDDAI